MQMKFGLDWATFLLLLKRSCFKVRYPAINDHHYSSLRNALRLLNLFSVDEPELQLQAIATRLEIGQSTAYRLVHTLIEEGFVMRDQSAKSYRLAASVLAMG